MSGRGHMHLSLLFQHAYPSICHFWIWRDSGPPVLPPSRSFQSRPRERLFGGTGGPNFPFIYLAKLVLGDGVSRDLPPASTSSSSANLGGGRAVNAWPSNDDRFERGSWIRS